MISPWNAARAMREASTANIPRTRADKLFAVGTHPLLFVTVAVVTIAATARTRDAAATCPTG